MEAENRLVTPIAMAIFLVIFKVTESFNTGN